MNNHFGEIKRELYVIRHAKALEILKEFTINTFKKFALFTDKEKTKRGQIVSSYIVGRPEYVEEMLQKHLELIREKKEEFVKITIE